MPNRRYPETWTICNRRWCVSTRTMDSRRCASSQSIDDRMLTTGWPCRNEAVVVVQNDVQSLDASDLCHCNGPVRGLPVQNV